MPTETLPASLLALFHHLTWTRWACLQPIWQSTSKRRGTHDFIFAHSSMFFNLWIRPFAITHPTQAEDLKAERAAEPASWIRPRTKSWWITTFFLDSFGLRTMCGMTNWGYPQPCFKLLGIRLSLVSRMTFCSSSNGHPSSICLQANRPSKGLIHIEIEWLLCVCVFLLCHDINSHSLLTGWAGHAIFVQPVHEGQRRCCPVHVGESQHVHPQKHCAGTWFHRGEASSPWTINVPCLYLSNRFNTSIFNQ